jgi:hypothetical protein
MPALVQAIGAMLLVAILSTSVWLGQTLLVTISGTQSQLSQAESQWPVADAAVTTALVNAVSANPSAPVSSAVFGNGWSSNGETISASLEGDTASGGEVDLASNLETNTFVKERRVAVNLTIAGGTSGAEVTQRLVYSVFTATPWVRLLGTETVGSASGRSIAAGADAGGCSGTGSGCDVDSVQAADDQRLGAGLSCALGANSGSCPSGNVYDESQYGSTTWTNQQSSETAH